MSIASKRDKWRKSIKSNGAYPAEEYARRIPVHVDTLKKYLGEFHKYLAVWISRGQNNTKVAAHCFGYERLEAVLAGDRPSIYEVVALFSCRDFSLEFMEYFIGKTHMSYDILPREPIPSDSVGPSRNGPVYSKLAEFIYIILAEYVVLNNYMWVSKKKPKGINSIDKWLKELRNGK